MTVVDAVSATKVQSESKNVLSIKTQKKVIEQYSRLKASGKIREANRLLSQYGFVKLGEEKIHQRFNKPIRTTQEKLNSDVSIQSWVSKRDLTLEIEYIIYPASKTVYISYYWTWDLVEDYWDRGDVDEISITNVIGQRISGESYYKVLVDFVDAWGYELEWGMIPGNHDVALAYEVQALNQKEGTIEHRMIFKVGDSIKKGVIHVVYRIHDDIYGQGGGISAHMIYTHTYGNTQLINTIATISGTAVGMGATLLVKHPLAGTVASGMVSFAVDKTIKELLGHEGLWTTEPIDVYIQLPRD
ncbi:hypothetical protein PNA2_1721 [Pyrococcus sp. NA2]|uniref:hypothetical protein n=1 Tax=Pyrococcus sp. (strain NA2) TaxID=342949 RepID=UPI000209AB13|nr:hypothetical protein [Pyrococcus sp. NA2]AEC52636.1 hypothetical protein PNA2_1721 [Pyrococcus sp. NA2]